MNNNIIGIYLAAGKSKRFGSDKLTHEMNGKPLGAHALETALQSGLHRVAAITKDKNVPWLQPFLKQEQCDQVICKKACFGQAHSIKCGLDYAILHQAEAVLVLLADQPFITTSMLQMLIEFYKKNKNTSFVAAHYEGIICPPILFSHHMFSDLYLLKGDRGAKHLLYKKASQGTFITFSDQQLFYDIDTKDDYKYIFDQT